MNDLPVQLATLRELAAHLIDIHSQNQGVLVADRGVPHPCAGQLGR